MRISILLMGLVCGLAACKKDCRKKPCKNGGICVEGTCQCSFPWEGYRCTSHANEKFIGNWQAGSDCRSSRDTLKMKIQAEGTRLRLIDEPLHKFDLDATLTTTNTCTIPPQRRRDLLLGEATISGRGEYRANIIFLYLKYDFDANFWDKECTHTLTRQ